MPGDQIQKFGGSWTEQKLEILREYLETYMKVMKKQPFHLVYIDAFAGTGYREQKQSVEEMGLFPDLASDESQSFLDGSVRIALRISRPFHEYVFIEASQIRYDELVRLRMETPQLVDRILVVKEDCNDYLEAYCRGTRWKGQRAVVFLDPFGMQVNWSTIRTMAATRSIDTWILFPLGVAVNRLLKKDGQIPDMWRRRLDQIFGTEDWFSEFYKEEDAETLFGKETRIRKSGTFESIARYYNQRLRDHAGFAGVADNPRLFCNSKGNPLFLFCFAAGNPKGAPIAMRIAQHILSKV